MSITVQTKLENTVSARREPPTWTVREGCCILFKEIFLIHREPDNCVKRWFKRVTEVAHEQHCNYARRLHLGH
jgi:hypothetical protein